MLNDKQEKFAQAYVLHRNASEAARAAGYSASSANNQGYRLLQIEEIVDRIHTLEQELVTDVDVISEIEKQYTYAKENGHTNSAIKALELLSRVRGANSDVSTNLDEETLEVAIIGCLNVLGENKVINLLTKCDFADGLFLEDHDQNGGPESVTEEGVEEALDLPQPEEDNSSLEYVKTP